MSIEGKLFIDLNYADASVSQVSIRSTRPIGATKIFIGKSPEQLLTLLPMLFNVCGNAQAYAAYQVCQQSLNLDFDAIADNARQLLVSLETIREHCWRILIDWPEFMGQVADKKQLAPFLRFNQSIPTLLFKQGQAFKLNAELHINQSALTQHFKDLETLVDEQVFQNQLNSWLQVETESQLLNWLQNNHSIPATLIKYVYQQDWVGCGANKITLLPELDGEILKQRIEKEGLLFSQLPDWQAQCFESTVLNRLQKKPLLSELLQKYGNSLLTRIVARLLEVSNSINALHNLSNSQVSKNFNGLARVQAARGLLIHYMTLEQDIITDYQIVAPTEWNFHPQGVVCESLKQLKANNETMLQKQATLLINTIDPCVSYQLNIKHLR